MTASLQIRLLGVRGSVPVHGPAFARFGGATSCVFCLAGKEAILLDAGSGLLWEELPQALPEKHFSVLLTHAHVDHILGFPMFAPLFDKTYECDVYLKYRQGRSAKEQVEALRPDAEAHVMLRGQVGAIECEARQRAAELEEHTAGQMHKALDLFRQQYQILMSTFETASSHRTAELRKMEVTLAQLPRTMDQTGVELDRLASALEKGTDAKRDKK